MTIQVTTDTKPLRRFIDRWTRIKMPVEIRRHWNRVGAIAANSYRKRTPGGPTSSGNLRKSVRYKVFSRQSAPGELPKIGIAIAPMGRLGSHRHLVEYGHTYRGIRYGGHPYAEAARAAAEKHVTDGLDEAIEASIRAAEL